MITKEKFVSIMNELIEKNEAINRVNDILRGKTDFYGIDDFGLIGTVIDVLELAFEDKEQWISWWFWETNCGNSNYRYWYSSEDVENDEGHAIENPEQLYDFLIDNYKFH